MVLINWVKLALSVAFDRSMVGISADSSQFSSFLLEVDELPPQAVNARAASTTLPAAKNLAFFMFFLLEK